jgi:hypothetical protein
MHPFRAARQIPHRKPMKIFNLLINLQIIYLYKDRPAAAKAHAYAVLPHSSACFQQRYPQVPWIKWIK